MKPPVPVRALAPRSEGWHELTPLQLALSQRGAGACDVPDRPLGGAERDVVTLQGVTGGDEVTELTAQIKPDGGFAEQLFTHGLGGAVGRGSCLLGHHREAV